MDFECPVKELGDRVELSLDRVSCLFFVSIIVLDKQLCGLCLSGPHELGLTLGVHVDHIHKSKDASLLNVVGLDIHQSQRADDWGEGETETAIAHVLHIRFVERAKFDGVLLFELKDHRNLRLRKQDRGQPVPPLGGGRDFLCMDFEPYKFADRSDAFGEHAQRDFVNAPTLATLLEDRDEKEDNPRADDGGEEQRDDLKDESIHTQSLAE